MPEAKSAKQKQKKDDQQQQQQQQQAQPGFALFPGLAKFKDDENKKPPPKGGAGVFSGFTGFAPRPKPTAEAIETKDDKEKKTSFKPSAFAKELGLESVPKELDAVKCANASEFAKEILG